jgi:leucyl aminopeptidase
MFSISTNTDQAVDVLIVPVLKGDLSPMLDELDQVHQGVISRAMKLEDFSGKKGEKTLLYTEDEQTNRILLVGLGDGDELSMRTWKHAIGSALIAAQKKQATSIGLVIPDALFELFDAKEVGKRTTIAISNAAYSFDQYKDKKKHVAAIESLQYIADIESTQKTAFTKGCTVGQAIATGISLTRDLGNTPPQDMLPKDLTKAAKKIAKEYNSVTVSVMGRKECAALGMGCFLGVAQGASSEPQFIVMEHNKKAGGKPVVLVGKGISYDTGGLSIKPSDYMCDMKFDMLGAATVVGTMRAIAELGVKQYVVGVVASCENSVSADSYRPDDVLKAMNGKTVEVKNTDAEGRLALADALSYVGKESKPKAVIDFATLTGACLVAIGNERSGLFSQDEHLITTISEVSSQTGEQFWRLPLGEEYTQSLKSTVADLKNIGGVGSARFGGASTAAAFLEAFTGDYPWAHVDLACSHYAKDHGYVRAGANGFGVETMVDWIQTV